MWSWHLWMIGFSVFSFVFNVHSSVSCSTEAKSIASARPYDAEDAERQPGRAAMYRRYARNHTVLAGFWVLMGLCSAVGLVRQARAFRRSERVAAGACPACGYDLTANVSGVCPECGERVPSRASWDAPQRLT